MEETPGSTRHVGVVSFVNSAYGFVYGFANGEVENRYFSVRKAPLPFDCGAGTWVSYSPHVGTDGRPQALDLAQVTDPEREIGPDAIGLLRKAMEAFRERGAARARASAEAAQPPSLAVDGELFLHVKEELSAGRAKEALTSLVEWLSAGRPVSNWDSSLHTLSKLLEAANERFSATDKLFKERLDGLIPPEFAYRREFTLAQAALRDLKLDAALAHALAAVKAKPNWFEGQYLVTRLRSLPAKPALTETLEPPPQHLLALGHFGENAKLVSEEAPRVAALAEAGNWAELRILLEDLAAHADPITAAVLWIDTICDRRWSCPTKYLQEFAWERHALSGGGRQLAFVFGQALCSSDGHALRALWGRLRATPEHVHYLTEAVREPRPGLLETLHRRVFVGFALEERLFLEALLDVTPVAHHGALVLQIGYAARDAGQPEHMLKQWFQYVTRRGLEQGTTAGSLWRNVGARLSERASVLEHGEIGRGLVAMCWALAGDEPSLSHEIERIRTRPFAAVPELTYRGRGYLAAKKPFHAIDSLLEALLVAPDFWPALRTLEELVRSSEHAPDLPETIFLQLDAVYERLLLESAGTRAAGLCYVQATLKELLGYPTDDVATALQRALVLQPENHLVQHRLRDLQADWLRRIQPGLELDDFSEKHRFKVLERHDNAHGGYGVVLKVSDRLADGQTRALKLPYLMIASDDARASLRARVDREAKKAMLVSGHPNIVQTIGVVGPNQDWILMEWVDGEKLDTFLEGYAARSFSAREVAYIGYEVVSALVHANKQAHDDDQGYFVHNDLAPWNIMLTGDAPNYGVKVFDFGLAHTGNIGSQTRTLLLDLREQRKYRAPELAQGLPPDERSDIFTLGVVLLELTRGARVSHEDIDAFRLSASDGIDAPLLAILKRMLAAEPDERSRLDELRIELPRFLASVMDS